jgi:hypothetical protein
VTNKKLLAALAPLAVAALAAAMAPGQSPSASSRSGSRALVGNWQRTNSCTALVANLRRAGVVGAMREVLVGGGYCQRPARIDPAAPCRRARSVKHSHFFTAAGGFGSRDENGNQVDDGDYRITAPHTLAFPSHAREFGYRIRVRYRITRGKLRFHVVVPHPCRGKCPGATAWAISAFYAGPAFTRAR